MKEELISFETAKLAKDKGFSSICFADEMGGDLFPTQSLLQKWLKEVHNIFINIFPVGLYLDGKSGYRFRYEIIDLKELKIIQDDKSLLGFLTYEEALEIALQQSLKLI